MPASSADNLGVNASVAQRDIGRTAPSVYRRLMGYDDIRQYAELSVRRGCGFALMAIVTAMVGFSGEPWIAVRAGAVFVLIAAVILYWRGRQARQRNYRHTEVWLMIEEAPALPRERLQTMIGGALAEVYFRYARRAAYVALTMCLIDLTLGGWAASAGSTAGW